MSKSRPGLYHAVDLHRLTCECEDFPRIWFCRHIAAVLFHFPELSPREISSTPDSGSSPEGTESQGHPQCVHAHRPETLQALTQDISVLSQTLAAESTAAQSTAAIEGARAAKFSLVAAIVATQGNAPLPNPDVIARNHKSWTETAKQMGIAKKSKRMAPAEDSGLTARSIGIVKGKRRQIHNDPYAGGERSGKCTKPDALSTANAPPLTVEHSRITLPGLAFPLQAHATVASPTSAPGIGPPPTHAPGIAPLGLAIPPLSHAAPPVPFTSSTHFPNQLHK